MPFYNKRQLAETRVFGYFSGLRRDMSLRLASIFRCSPVSRRGSFRLSRKLRRCTWEHWRALKGEKRQRIWLGWTKSFFGNRKKEGSSEKDFGSFIPSWVSSNIQPTQTVVVEKEIFFSKPWLGCEPEFLTVFPCSWLPSSLIEGVLVLEILCLARASLILVGLEFHELRRGEQEPSWRSRA